MTRSPYGNPDAGSNPLGGIEEIQSSISRIETHRTVLENGLAVQLVDIFVDKDAILDIFGMTDFGENQIIVTELFGAENAEMSITASTGLDKNETYVYGNVFFSFSVVGVDGELLDAGLEGSTIDMTMRLEVTQNYSGHEAEFDPIVAPTIETEEE